MNLISLNSVNLSFSGKPLFSNLSLGIQRGDFIGLIGPNGAGKSTLLKVMLKHQEPDSGEVVWMRNLRVGYLTQTPEFIEGVTIFDELTQGSYETEVLAATYEWISRIGLNQFDVETQAVTELSRGWQKKVALLKELIAKPDVLILDEPTNHLDLDAIMWLESFLNEAKFTIVMVTHDKLFLQRTAKCIMCLDHRLVKGFLNYSGTFDAFLAAREQLKQSQLATESKMKNLAKRELEWLRRGAQARQTKQIARSQKAVELQDNLREMVEINKARTVKVKFAGLDKLPKKIVELENVTKKKFNSDEALFSNLSLNVLRDSRIGIIGPNGAGKSTLLKTIIGQIKPDLGSVKIQDNIKITYFEQDRSQLDPNLSVIQNVCHQGDYVNYQGEFVHVRSYLEKFLFFGQKVDQPASRLSGGEQARLRIAQLMLNQSHILILDEPTNDLDLETVGALEEALQAFNGAILVVSHDRYFLDQVTDQLLSFSPNDKRLHLFSGFFQWESWYQEEIQIKSQAPDEISALNEVATNTPNKLGIKKLSFRENRELAEIEGLIQSAESQLSELNLQISDPNTTPLDLKVKSQEIANLHVTVDSLYARWAELEKRAK